MSELYVSIMKAYKQAALDLGKPEVAKEIQGILDRRKRERELPLNLDSPNLEPVNENLLDETPGLTLSAPRIAYKDEDDLEGRLEIDINGKTYKYRLNPGTDMTTMELISKIAGMQKYSDGKALAYLKRNAHTVTESFAKGSRVKLDNYMRADNGKIGTSAGRLGELVWVDWDDGTHSKEIKGHLSEIKADMSEALNSGGATQVSNVGQHKCSSIDLIDMDEDEEDR